MSSLDDTGNIRNRAPFEVIKLHHSDHRVQSGEWIRSDLGASRTQLRREGRFPRIGESHHPGICDASQLKIKHPLCSLGSKSELLRCPIGRTPKLPVPFSPFARFANDELVALGCQVCHKLQIYSCPRALHFHRLGDGSGRTAID